jgi:hypothetical protein
VSKTFDFGELRSLLQQEPSAQVWEQLCALVGGARWDKAAEQWLPYAEDHLARRWPDRLRTWPAAWRGKAVAASALARHLVVQGTNTKNMSRCVDALEAGAPPLTGMSVVLGKESGPVRRLLRASPATLTRLELTGAVPLDALLDHAPLGRLSALRMAGLALDDAGLGRVLDATGEQLRELGVIRPSLNDYGRARLTPDGLEPLVEGGHAARLVTLDLSGSRMAHHHFSKPDHKNAGIRRLASAEWPVLERLVLDDLHLDDAGELGRLVAQMPALRELELGRNILLGNQELVALFGQLRGPLRMVGLLECHLDDAKLARMLGLEQMQQLEVLDLRACRPGRETGLLLRGEAGARLEVLRLTWSTHREAMQLAEAMAGGALPALRELGVIPSVAFIDAMAKVELPSLRRLTHEHTGAMKPEVVEAVRRAPWGAQLEDMSGAG